MNATEFYARLLGLSQPWEVVGVRLDMEQQEVEVEVACQSPRWGGEEGQRLHLHGYEERRWGHLDTCQLRTIIQAKVPRVLDPATGKTQMVSVPWVGPRSQWTLMFESFIIKVLQGCATMSEATRQGVQAASMDFGAAYAKATREAAPQARIVYDRFHVSQLLHKGVD